MGKHDLSDLVRDRGQAWLERPGYRQSLIVQRCTNPQNVYLSCTKGDLRLRSRGMPGFVLGINSQLVEIDSSRRLSRIVRNLASFLCKMFTIVCSKMIYHMFGIG